MYLMLKFPKILSLVRPEMKKQHRSRTLKQLNSAAGLVCVSTKKTTIQLEGAVQAGRLMMRVWLRLTQLGFGVQPISLATLPILFQQENLMDHFFIQKLNFFKDGEQILKNAFKIRVINACLTEKIAIRSNCNVSVQQIKFCAAKVPAETNIAK